MHLRLKLLLPVLLTALAIAIWHQVGYVGLRRGASSSAVPAQGGLAAPKHGGEPARDGRPNVLLISLDTVRPDHLGCYGYPRPTSPNLDRFAQSCIRFTQARAQAPWTTPSHMSLFTSMLPSSNQIDTLPALRLSPQIPTLAEVLQRAGYVTAGIVNRGGVERDWGFDRGFGTYTELSPLLPADLDRSTAVPEGRGDHITALALQWLAHAPRQPWFLFLHYFDAHHPYISPEPFHSRLGAVPTAQANQLLFAHLRPEMPFADPADLGRLVNSYDAAIAALDDRLAPLLSAVPADTMVVIFSDHGEAFKEHGWTWHGATLYEEEIRCALLMRLPAGAGAGGGGEATASSPVAERKIDEPVMLMDVAPTILAECGIAAPATFEGLDLHPLLEGRAIGPRFIASETKSTRGGRLSKSLIQPPWKLIYDMISGKRELYRLPDEATDLASTSPAPLAALWAPLQHWVEQDRFWIVSYTGPGLFEGRVGVADGQMASAIELNVGEGERGDYRLVLGGQNYMEWRARPGARVQGLYIRPLPADAPLAADLRLDGQPVLDRVFVGRSGAHPTAMPTEFWIGPPATVPPPAGHDRLTLGTDELSSPIVTAPFVPAKPGFYIRRFGTAAATAAAAANAPTVPSVARERIEQLRGLGYME